MKKYAVILVMLVVAVGLLAGCSSPKKDSPAAAKEQVKSYKDGTYTAKSSSDERGAVGEITLVIEKGKITKAEYKGIMKDGKIKDIDYGKTNGKIENQEFYNKAQNAVKAIPAYPAKLVETQDVAKIDAISGATVSYNQFAEAVKKALEQARQ